MIEASLLAAAAFVLIGAAYSDLRAYRIPNLLPAALILLFVAFRAQSGFSDADWWHAAHFGIALLIGMLLFGLRWIGGGDAKLYAAAALWFPLVTAPLLIFLVGIAGLVLAVITILTRKRARRQADGKKMDRRIAYGVAISVGTVACWFLQPATAPSRMIVGELSGKNIPQLR